MTVYKQNNFDRLYLTVLEAIDDNVYKQKFIKQLSKQFGSNTGT